MLILVSSMCPFWVEYGFSKVCSSIFYKDFTNENFHLSIECRSPDKCLFEKYFFITDVNISCVYSKEPSQWDGSLSTQNTCFN